MKKIFSAVAFVAACLTASAQSISVADVTIEENGTAQVVVNVDNATKYNAAGMFITLPEAGFGFVYDEEEENYCLGGDVFAKSHTVESNLQKQNQLKFAVVSMKNAAFKTDEGSLVECTISTTAEAGEYQGKVWGTNKFSWIDKTAAQEVDDVTFKITVTSATGIQALNADEAGSTIYNVAGTVQNSIKKGVNIVKMNNGQVKKVMVK